jgi:hypothetical protein
MLGSRGNSLLPIIPNKNDVAEQNNITIMEVVKTMIHDQDIPMCLWAKELMGERNNGRCICAEPIVP